MKKIFGIIIVLFLLFVGLFYYQSTKAPMCGTDLSSTHSSFSLVDLFNFSPGKSCDIKNYDDTLSPKKKSREEVCCQTGAVVPNAEYSYNFVSKNKCKPTCNIENIGGVETEVCAIGTSFRVVSDHFCEKREKQCYQIGDGTYHLLDRIIQDPECENDFDKCLLGGAFREVDDSFCK